MSYSLDTPLADRIVSALAYMTMGWIGVFYLIFLYIKKKPSSRFIRFNTIQSIFLTLLIVVVSMACKIILGFLAIIPIIKILVAHIEFIFNQPIIFDYSLIQLCIVIMMMYTVSFSLMGKYPKIYKISDILEKSAG